MCVCRWCYCRFQSQCQFCFCCFALPFLQLKLHLWQANMAINWLNKSLRNALSAKPSKTNPPFVLQYCMQGEQCRIWWSCWLNQGWELSVRQLCCEAGCKEGGGGISYSWYYGLDVLIYLIWRVCFGEREREMVPLIPTLYAQNAEFVIYPEQQMTVCHNHLLSLIVSSQSSWKCSWV